MWQNAPNRKTRSYSNDRKCLKKAQTCIKQQKNQSFLTGFFWSWWPDLNRWPHPYQGCALPAELHQHTLYKVAETLHRVTPYQGCALPAELHQHAFQTCNGDIIHKLRQFCKSILLNKRKISFESEAKMVGKYASKPFSLLIISPFPAYNNIGWICKQV